MRTLLPETVRKQISEADERLPARGSAGQPSIETCVEDERLPGRIAHCPKIPNGMAAQERLREVPDFTRKRELSDDRSEMESVWPNWTLCTTSWVCSLKMAFAS